MGSVVYTKIWQIRLQKKIWQILLYISYCVFYTFWPMFIKCDHQEESVAIPKPPHEVIVICAPLVIYMPPDRDSTLPMHK